MKLFVGKEAGKKTNAVSRNMRRVVREELDDRWLDGRGREENFLTF